MKVYLTTESNHDGDTILGVSATIDDARRCANDAMQAFDFWGRDLEIQEWELGEHNFRFDKQAIEVVKYEAPRK